MTTASDAEEFCPGFSKLSIENKQKVFVQLVSGIVNYESAFKLNTYSVEPESSFPDKDSITGKPVASEGLMQLSYQDENSYRGKFSPGICVFDWSRDKILLNKNVEKTIFDPKTNLSCGIAILNLQVKQHGVIFYSKSYWAVLRPNGKYGQVTGIKAIVKKLEICQ